MAYTMSGVTADDQVSRLTSLELNAAIVRLQEYCRKIHGEDSQRRERIRVSRDQCAQQELLSLCLYEPTKAGAE